MKDSLKILKKDYEKLKHKYNLPQFKELNEKFDIEKVAENETDYLLRDIRKSIVDKIITYLRFIEMLMNPSNAPLFFLALVKGLTHHDKKILEKIYGKLGQFEIEAIGLDCRYNEKAEADFIKEITKEWKEIEEEMLKLVEVLRKNWKQKSRQNNRGYCG